MFRHPFRRSSRPLKRTVPALRITNLEDRLNPGAFTAGNLVMYRVGDGSAALTSAATAAFLDEYTPTGTLVQTIAVPTADSGANQALTNSGSATSEGTLTRSADGNYLTFGGYDAAPGTASIASSATAANARVYGRVGANGVIDTSTVISATNFNANNLRGVVTTNGTDMWGVGGNSGVVYQTFGGSGAGTVVSSTFTNMRVVSVFNNQLYVSSGSSTLRLGTVGTGTPTGTGNTITNLNGLPTASYSPYGFFFADLSVGVAGVDTVYLAADDVDSVRKYTFNGTTWSLTGEVITSGADYRHLTATVSGSTVTLFVVADNGTGADTLMKLVDATGYNGTLSGTPTLVATAAANTAFRGVALSPTAPPNNAPTLNGANNFTAINEDILPASNTGDTVASLIAGQTTDPDSGALKGIAITGTSTTNGTWEYSTNGGSSWTNVGAVAEASALLLTDNANTRIRFVPNANYNGTVSNGLTFRAWDQTSGSAGNKVDTTTNGGTTAFSTAQVSASLTVNAVNDAPVNTVPGRQFIPVSGTFTFTGATALSIADSDAGAAPIEVTLSVDTGTLSLGSLANLSFTTGDGIADATMTFTGTIADINSALNNTVYQAPGSATTATLTLLTNDQGNTGGAPVSDSDTVTLHITNQVNQPPVNTLPIAQSTPEETTLTLNTTNGNLMSISDIDAGSDAVQVTLNAVGGVLSLNGVTGLIFTTGDGIADATMTFTGTIADINTALNGLTYTPSLNFTGAGSVQIITNDLGNFGLGGPQIADDTLAISVTPVNDAPVNTVPGPITTFVNSKVAFTGVRSVAIADIDAGTAPVEVTLSVDAGALTLGSSVGLTFTTGDGVADATMTFTGTIADINAALATLIFATPASDTVVTFTITTNDQSNTGTGGPLSDTDTVTINVFDLPIISEIFVNPPGTDAPNEYVELRGTPNSTIPTGVYLLGIEGDGGTGAGDVQTIFNLSGQTFGSNGYLVLLQNANTYTPDANATTLTSTTTGFGGLPSSMFSADSGGTDIENPSVTFMIVKTSTAPTLTDDIDSDNNGVPDGSVYAGWTVADAIAITDAATDTAYAPLVFAAVAPPLRPAGTVVVNTGSTTASYIGRTSENVGIGSSDWVGGNVAGTAPAYNLVGNGQTSPVGFGGDPLNHLGSANFPAGAFNDAPINTVPAADINTIEDTPVTLAGLNLFAVSDVDAGTGQVQVSLTASNGTLTLNGVAGLTFITGDGTDDPSLTFRGTLTALNTALNGMVLTPAANFFGPSTLQITTDDLGSTGADGAKTDSDSVNVVVASANDSPTGTDGSITLFATESYTFTEADFDFNDANDTPPNSFVSVTITTLPAVGTLKLSGTPINAGAVIALADISNGNLTFEATSGVGFPAGSFTFQVQDDGGILNGGVELDPTPNTITINIDVPNNPPTGAAKTIVINEDSSHTFALADFGFDDSADAVPDSFSAVKISTLPLVGTLTLNNGAISLGQIIPVADIVGGLLKYTPVSNANGAGYASFTFQVQDNGGTVNGGVDLDPTADTITFDVTPVNDAPSGTDTAAEVEGNSTGVLPASAFTITDIDASGGTTYFVQITTLPSLGSLTFNGVPVTLNHVIALSDIAAGKLEFTPIFGAVGSPYTTFTFQIQDSDGTANGGSDLDPTPNTFTINVSQPNEPPVLASGDTPLNPVTRNSSNNPGQTVASFIEDRITDPDANALEGIAITTLASLPANGTWQYSLDGGTTWVTINNITPASSLLLRATDKIRFEPALGFVGDVVFTYRAWDQTHGVAGGTLDLDNGTSDSVSVTENQATLIVGIPLPNVPEDSKAPPTSLVSALLLGNIADPDFKAKQGIAITNVTGQQFGVWQYFMGGWKTINATPTAALLLSSTTKIRFKPLTNATGTATLVFKAWDQTSGKNGGTSDTTASGAGTAFSTNSLQAFATVTPVNDAPMLDVSGNPPLTRVLPFDTDPAGDPVGDLLGTTVTDVENNPIQMAVTGVSGKGVWQYQLAGNPTWFTLAGSAKVPFLLNAADRVRFVPLSGVSGTAKLLYKAFDGQAFSKLVEVGNLTVGTGTLPPTNTAPVLNTVPTPTLPTAPEDSKPTGATVATLISAAIADPDAGAKQGIAVTGMTGVVNGVWQYSANGKVWKAMGTVSATDALLLRATDWVRFLPNKDFHGSATLSYQAWDQTRGGFGFRANPTKGMGGSGPFSLATETATVTITPVNDAPVLNVKPVPKLTSVLPTDGNPAGDLVQALLGTAATDVDGDTLKMAITAVSGSGTWQYQLDGTSTWSNIEPVATDAPRLLDLLDRVRFVPATGVSGTGKLTYKVSDGTLLSKAIETATITVNAVDDRPVLNAAIKPVLNPVLAGDVNSSGILVSALLAGAVTDADASAALGIALTFTDVKNGTWQYSTDGGATWVTITSVSVGNPLRLAGTARLRFQPNVGFTGTTTIKYKAWDSASIDPNGPLALSTAIATASLSVNTAPTLA